MYILSYYYTFRPYTAIIGYVFLIKLFPFKHQIWRNFLSSQLLHHSATLHFVSSCEDNDAFSTSLRLSLFVGTAIRKVTSANHRLF
jgi:hypothetical protein